MPTHCSIITGLLLAAGRSRRFGADKLSASLPDGTSVAVAACRALREGVGRVYAVLRPDQEALAELLRAEGAETGFCVEADQGMGASLAFGVLRTREAGGWVVALADMPWIKPDTIGQVAAELAQGSPLVAPFHGGRRGHPVGFGPQFGDELAWLAGDEGARSILARHADCLRRVEVDDPGILLDIDEPDDLLASRAAVLRQPGVR